MDKIVADINNRKGKLRTATNPNEIVKLQAELAQLLAWDADKEVDPKQFGYEDFTHGGQIFTAMEELHRWRLFEPNRCRLDGRTGQSPT